MNKILELFKKNQHQNQESHVNSDDTSKNSEASVVGEKRDHAAMQANKSTKSRKKYTRPWSLTQQLHAQKTSNEETNHLESIRYEYWEPDEETLAEAGAVFDGDYDKFWSI